MTTSLFDLHNHQILSMYQQFPSSLSIKSKFGIQLPCRSIRVVKSESPLFFIWYLSWLSVVLRTICKYEPLFDLYLYLYFFFVVVVATGICALLLNILCTSKALIISTTICLSCCCRMRSTTDWLCPSSSLSCWNKYRRIVRYRF